MRSETQLANSQCQPQFIITTLLQLRSSPAKHVFHQKGRCGTVWGSQSGPQGQPIRIVPANLFADSE